MGEIIIRKDVSSPTADTAEPARYVRNVDHPNTSGTVGRDSVVAGRESDRGSSETPPSLRGPGLATRSRGAGHQGGRHTQAAAPSLTRKSASSAVLLASSGTRKKL